MTFATAEPPKAAEPNKPRRNGIRLRPRLWLAVAAVFALQVALVFWLGNPPAAKIPQIAIAPTVHFAGDGSAEMLALLDPTLLVLPHYDNFSAAWLKVPRLSFTPPQW